MGNRTIFASRWFFVLLAVTVMAGCGRERSPIEVAAAIRTSNVPPLVLETYGEDERDAIRVKMDTARGRLWVLGLDHVRVYDTVTKKLIRQVALPGWSVVRSACDPSLALDRSGSPFISSNVIPRIWRIDARNFDVKVHEISLEGREWDTGFGALAFAEDGTLYGLSSALGSLWKIDVARASASMIQLNQPPAKACAFTAQFLKDFERSGKPWTRPLPQQS